MSTMQMGTKATEAVKAATMDAKLEVVLVPVSDAERAKQFYGSLGWRLDADFVFSAQSRILQFTPPGSEASIIFGTGVTASAPGSIEGLVLAVDDIEAAREDLVARGIDVSDVFHGVDAVFGTEERKPGPDPEHATYQSFVSFSDPDGNGWLLQEVSTRAPGRTWTDRVSFGSTDELVAALRRAEEAHGGYEAQLGHRHDDWAPWYAEYMVREQAGAGQEVTA
jgi:catechol 2,3-dioxygenase-like lactoylglutathione lyase family enzyme